MQTYLKKSDSFKVSFVLNLLRDCQKSDGSMPFENNLFGTPPTEVIFGLTNFSVSFTSRGFLREKTQYSSHRTSWDVYVFINNSVGGFRNIECFVENNIFIQETTTNLISSSCFIGKKFTGNTSVFKFKVSNFIIWWFCCI